MALKRLIIVSNRLPFSIENEDETAILKPSSGGLVSAIRGFIECSKDDVTFDEIIWCGNPGCKSKTWKTIEFPSDDLFNYLPVFTPNKVYNDFYNGFANSTLWPLFHYFPSYTKYNDTHWNAYKKVNEKFHEVLQKEITENDVVWVQDYHLMLLPALLRKSFPKLTIGFFLHIPFPTYELIRLLPNQWQDTIIKGLLGADLVGFHTTEYVAHFVETVQSILGITHQGVLLPYENRLVLIDHFPISIHYEQFNSAYDKSIVRKGRKKLKEFFNHKKIIFSIDRLDYTKGISNRITAFEEFLKKYPEYQANVVFILVIIPSRDKIDKYEERKKMIDESISRVNSSIGTIDWQPIIYRYRSLNFDELLTLYTAADVALITPIRDGMNLVAKEFIASRADKKGVLILSELAGSAKELHESVIINPNDTHDLCDKIYHSLQISQETQTKDISKMQERIKRFDIKKWASSFLCKLTETHQLNDQLNIGIESSENRFYLPKELLNSKTIPILIYMDSKRDKDDIQHTFHSIQQLVEHNEYIQIHLVLNNGENTDQLNISHSNFIVHYLNSDKESKRNKLPRSLEEVKVWFQEFVEDHSQLEIRENKLIWRFSEMAVHQAKVLFKSVQKLLQLNNLSSSIQFNEIIIESNNSSIRYQLLEYILQLEKEFFLMVGLPNEHIAYLQENIWKSMKMYSIKKDSHSIMEQITILLKQLINK
jgi:trehalose 6-phosphate synthase/phosphatase